MRPEITATTGGVRLWLDDDSERRPTPPGWMRAFSVNEAIGVLSTHDVAYASLDHDLGDYFPDGGDGAKVTDWLAEHGRWPTQGINVHSGNPPGLRVMLATIDTYSPYPIGYTRQRGTPPPGGWPIVLH